ncbi:MAG: class I SAM-dependent methyltransferase [Prochloron sp. SP5CPC1]|nr:class I SAM-dependent methyltransferase [Candidatus Paraprochloron terpiosi SP5CPC1]
MTMREKEHTLSSTAFLTAIARARRKDVSLDSLAPYWLPANMEEDFNAFHQRYLQQVCDVEDIGLALRNRYFLTAICDFQSANPEGVFINFAAGLSSYPYLLEQSIESYEIDLAEMIEFKASRIQQIIEQLQLPQRPVHFLVGDLSDPEESISIFETLAHHIDGRPTFVLLEGISYYLKAELWQFYLGRIAEIQETNSVLAFDFWPPSALQHPVFQRLRSFYQDEFDWPESDFQLIDPNSLTMTSGYSNVKITHALAEEAAFFQKSLPDRYDATFLEHFAVLHRRKS